MGEGALLQHPVLPCEIMSHSRMQINLFNHVTQSRCTDIMFLNRFKLFAVTLNSNIQNIQQCGVLE